MEVIRGRGRRRIQNEKVLETSTTLDIVAMSSFQHDLRSDQNLIEPSPGPCKAFAAAVNSSFSWTSPSAGYRHLVLVTFPNSTE
jgi:hypothetical protein